MICERIIASQQVVIKANAGYRRVGTPDWTGRPWEAGHLGGGSEIVSEVQ